jgi:tetratricopeptide (TPR) repeat protein
MMARLILLSGVLLVGLGCSQYEPFDSVGHLREQYSQRLGEETAGDIEVPYHLSAGIIEEIIGRLSPGGSERARTQAIVDFVFGVGGLDLQYQLTPTRSAEGTYYARQGNCLSFVNLFVGIARAQRLNPYYVEVVDQQRWNYKNGVVVSQGHIVAGLQLDGQMSTFDFLPYRPKSYRNFRPIDDLTATAHFYNNLGGEALLADDLERAETALGIATKLAPDFDKALNNLGVLYLRTDRIDQALEIYDKGLAVQPDNVAFLTNKARALQLLGRDNEALTVLNQVEDTKQTSPFFFVYRADLALANGDFEEAMRQLRKGLRTDSEVPEVHVGLVKVYLAMGETDKARHHVERALKLDATHREARGYAAMLSQPARDNR